MTLPRRLATGMLLLGGLLGATPGTRADGAPDDAIAAVEAEFRTAARRVRLATVSCVPWGVPQPLAGFSSGVLVSSDGLVLSDADVGLRWGPGGGRAGQTWRDDVEVRVPRGEGRSGFDRHRARVLHRDRDADSTILRILNAPPRGFPTVPLGRSDDVRVGDFAFVLGTAFDEDGRSPATLTAGVIASTDLLPGRTSAGRHRWLYTSTAVNRGVNGGPVVDLDGRLVGTVSTWVEADATSPEQLLGKIVPVDRLRALHAGRTGALRIPGPVARGTSATAGPGRALQTVFRASARRAASQVVSLTVRRRRPVSTLVPAEAGGAPLTRFEGPVSGVVVTTDGWIVTSLYNLTNVGSLVEPLWEPPAGADVEAGLSDILAVAVDWPQGGRSSARLVAHDRRLGIALLRATVPPGTVPTPGPVAPATAFQAGRFVLALGNPFGAQRRADPLLTTGILSRGHPLDAAAAWRGQWQTDAAGLDTNSGGAAVDLEGRLLGLFTLWYPARHGRSSGVAFIVPWQRILEALPALQAGRSPERGFLGVRFGRRERPVVAEIVAGTPAAAAGLRVGDVLHRVDREDVPTVAEAIAVIGFRSAGEVVRLRVDRGGTLQDVEVRLGVRRKE